MADNDRTLAAGEAVKPPSSANPRQQFYVYVPALLRSPAARGARLRLLRYPPRNVDPYDVHEAMDILRIFNKRWFACGRRPPPELEPRAVRVDGGGEDMVLYDVDRAFYGEPPPADPDALLEG